MGAWSRQAFKVSNASGRYTQTIRTADTFPRSQARPVRPTMRPRNTTSVCKEVHLALSNTNVLNRSSTSFKCCNTSGAVVPNEITSSREMDDVDSSAIESKFPYHIYVYVMYSKQEYCSNVGQQLWKCSHLMLPQRHTRKLQKHCHNVEG